MRFPRRASAPSASSFRSRSVGSGTMPSGGDFFPDLPLDRFPSGLSEKHTEVSGRQSVLPPSSRRFPAPFGFGGFFVSVPSLFRCGMRSGLSGGTRLQGCAGISDCLSACLSYGRTPSRHRCGLFALWLRRGVLFVRFRLFFGTECATTFPGTEEGLWCMRTSLLSRSFIPVFGSRSRSFPFGIVPFVFRPGRGGVGNPYPPRVGAG